MASMAPRGNYRAAGKLREGVRVTGQVAVARHLAGVRGVGGRVEQQFGTRRIAWASSHLREAVEADVGGTVAAMPEQTVAVMPEQTVAVMPEKGASPDVAWLVRRAAGGDRWAWEWLVERYARLIWAMTRDFKLAESDAADVTQVTWLRLLEHIDRLEQPARVGSWLAATARNECLRNLAARQRVVPGGDDLALNDVAAHEPEIDEQLLADERAKIVRAALARLPWRWQRLLELLMADPPASYAEISDELGLPVGSIGPTRGRCLARLRMLLQAS
jgi:RNA polymerase sigma factor (sigma-70 family)